MRFTRVLCRLRCVHHNCYWCTLCNIYMRIWASTELMLTLDYRPKLHHFHLQPHLLNDNSFVYARFHNLEKPCSIKSFRRFSCTCTLWYKILLIVALIFLTVSHSNLIFSHNPLSSRPISSSNEVIISYLLFARYCTIFAYSLIFSTIIPSFMPDSTSSKIP